MIIGMDFGTTNSGIAVYDGHKLQFVPIDRAEGGGSVARTALYLTNDRQVYIGRHAIDTYFAQNLNRPVRMGRVWVGEITLTFAELPSFVRDVYVDKDLYAPGRLFLSFKMALPLSNYVGTVVGSHFYFIEDIVALYLYIARQRAEAQLGQPVTRIVLGRPVRYSFDPLEDQLARERMLKAAFQAGYDEVYFEYEPLAAACHYEQQINQPQTVLIFDFGGGTLDISIVRVGDPQQRAVLANGGVPIAGDIFDQKLVRARLPRHFGEGTHYRQNGHQLPVPGSFYEAFANWQEMLSLQRTETLESLDRIAQTAERPAQLRALRSLIASSYGLKMFDIVETAKRQLSTGLRADIRLQGEGFNVYEPVTRSEFEAIIRPEIRTIDAFIDEMLIRSGLRADQIDVVIRTGGSSLIPAFVNSLETRFGADKVRSLDSFSSVTSGLGILGYQLARGEVELPAHRRADYAHLLNTDAEQGWVRGDVPAVEFETMKKFITLVERATDDRQTVGLVAQDSTGQVVAAAHEAALFMLDADGRARHPLTLAGLGLGNGALTRLISAPADDRLLLATSDYRLMVKTARQLAALRSAGLALADAEGFKRDVFGDEVVSGISPLPAAPRGDLLLVTTVGYFKTFGAALIERLMQPVPYQTDRLRGHPLAVLPLTAGHDLALFTASGRGLRLTPEELAGAQGRLMKIRPDDRLIAALVLRRGMTVLLATADGAVAGLKMGDIPAAGLNSGGTKIIARRALQAVLAKPVGGAVWAATSARLLPLDTGALTTSADLPARPALRLRLRKGETLVSLL